MLAQTPTAQAPPRGRRVRLYAQRGRLARGHARRGARAAAAHPRCLSKRVRERRFNVWHGTAPADGGQLAAVMLPDRFDYDASQELADLDGLPGYRHQGTFLVAEIEGGPLARYDHGRITGYVGPTAAAPVGAGDVQWRSAIVDIPVRRAERRWMLPPSGRASRWHTSTSWQTKRVRMLKFVWQPDRRVPDALTGAAETDSPGGGRFRRLAHRPPLRVRSSRASRSGSASTSISTILRSRIVTHPAGEAQLPELLRQPDPLFGLLPGPDPRRAHRQRPARQHPLD
jgi:hypothetical protein